MAAFTLAACDEPPPQPPQPRPVRAVTVERHASGETRSLTGQIRARTETSLAFRLDGRVLERPVNVGDTVSKGQVIARLDPHIQQNDLRRAQASLSAARGQLTQVRSDFQRQQELLETGHTPRSRYDQARQVLQTAEAQVSSAEAQLRNAEEQLSFTVLSADADGTVTAIGAEAGEVTAAGRMVARIAHQDGRDAVFDVPAQIIRTAPPDPVVEIRLTDDPTITALGRVREVAPQADPTTRTHAVKVGLIDPPPAMMLGATVTGRVTLTAPEGVELPATALTRAGGGPAVWVVDPATKSVSLRPVDVLRYDTTTAVIAQGLGQGETVVTAGVQVLRPGQVVRLLEDER